MATEKSSEVLPEGWIREAKERPSGRTDWYYINLKTGEKCRSKTELARLTKSGNLSNDMPRGARPSKRCSKDTKKQSVLPMEDLPDGWSMVTKTIESGKGAVRQYKGVVEKHTAEELPPGCIKEIKSVVEKHTAEEELPPGWIKQIKVSQVAGQTRKDPYYIDPVSGYEFRSKRDVFRYLESGDLGKCKIRPKKGQISAMESIDGEISLRDTAIHSTESASKGVVENHTAEELLPGCIKEIKVTQVADQTRKEPSVVEKHTAEEELPPGWIKQIKVTQVAGRTRKDPYYIDPVSGYEFRSKRDVFRYLESGDLGKCKIRPKKGQISAMESIDGEISLRDTAIHSTESASKGVVENHTAEELLPGCIEEIKVAQVADQTRKDPSVVEKHTAEEELPPGWIKQIKVTQVAGQTRKDPYYIDPVTGYEFRSKKDVFRYLESGDLGKCKIRPKKRQISDMESIDGVISAPTAAKRHKIADNATRRSLFTGQSSRVSKAVEDELVLESSVVQECLSLVEECLLLPMVALDGESSQMISAAHQGSEGIKNEEGKMVCAENGLIGAPGAEVSQEMQPMEKLHSADRESSRLINTAKDSGVLENTEEKIICDEKAADFFAGKQPSEKSYVADGESSELALEFGGLENMKEKMVCAEKALISAPAAEASQEKQPSEKSVGKRKKGAPIRTSSIRDGKELPLPRRASKRLAGLQAELEPDLGIFEQALRTVAGQSVNLEANPASVNHSSCNHQVSKEVDPPGLQAELAPDLGMSERALRTVAKQSVNLVANPASVNPSSCNHQASKELDPPEAAAEVVVTPHTSTGLGVLLDENVSEEVEKPSQDQAAPGELARKLESEKQSTEKPEPPLVLPFGDSWPDPCLEFAFKTLTGAISVDDNLAIGGYFQQNFSMDKDQNSSGFTLPDLGLDGFCQTDILFQFDATEKPEAKQLSPCNPTFTSLENCGMPASGDGVSQQPKGEGGKE